MFSLFTAFLNASSLFFLTTLQLLRSILSQGPIFSSALHITSQKAQFCRRFLLSFPLAGYIGFGVDSLGSAFIDLPSRARSLSVSRADHYFTALPGPVKGFDQSLFEKFFLRFARITLDPQAIDSSRQPVISLLSVFPCG
jgi:hypothetical protein